MQIIRCQLCKHYFDGLGSCEAFREIPAEIFAGDNDHTKPLKGQDNDIVFEPIKKTQKKRKKK